MLEKYTPEHVPELRVRYYLLHTENFGTYSGIYLFLWGCGTGCGLTGGLTLHISLQVDLFRSMTLSVFFSSCVVVHVLLIHAVGSVSAESPVRPVLWLAGFNSLAVRFGVFRRPGQHCAPVGGGVGPQRCLRACAPAQRNNYPLPMATTGSFGWHGALAGTARARVVWLLPGPAAAEVCVHVL